MVHDKLSALTERLKQKRKSVRADKRARARRIQRGEPQGLREHAAVTKKEASEAVDAAGLLASEYGLTREQAESTLDEMGELVGTANATGQRDALDTDGDGDTDVLQIAEAVADRETQEEQSMQRRDEAVPEPRKGPTMTGVPRDDPLGFGERGELPSGEAASLGRRSDGEVEFF